MPNFKMRWNGVSVSDLCFMYLECIIIVYKDIESCKI